MTEGSPKTIKEPPKSGESGVARQNDASKGEDELGRKLDRCLADGLLKVGGGLGVGILFSVVLFKRRAWPVIFGTGIGVGMSLANCQNDLKAPYLVRGRKVKAAEVAGAMKPTDYVILLEKPATN